MRRLVAALGALVVVAGCSTTHSAGSSPTPTIPAATASATSPVTSGPASPAPTAGHPASVAPTGPALVAPVTFDSVSFIDGHEGWAAGGTGVTATTLLVSHTIDGGRTWSAGVAVTARPAPRQDVAVRFVDPLRGWVSTMGLFSTADGGRTWVNAGLPGWLGPVAPAGSGGWALDYPCGVSQQCTPVLIAGSVGGPWAPLPHQPPLPAGPATLVRPSATTAFIAGAAASGGSPVFVRTTDGGATWITPANPCTGTLTHAQPATLDGAHLWMACGAGPGDETQDKAVFTSADGGAGWKLMASTGGDAPPVTGSLTPAGTIVELDLASQTTGFLVLAGYGVLRSTDGGATWKPTSVTARSIPSGGDATHVTFADPADGWATTCCGGGVPQGSPGLFSTTNAGATWAPAAVSP
jgi:photosystem II stability/assembly factor-like uncharacterized protein